MLSISVKTERIFSPDIEMYSFNCRKVKVQCEESVSVLNLHQTDHETSYLMISLVKPKETTLVLNTQSLIISSDVSGGTDMAVYSAPEPNLIMSDFTANFINIWSEVFQSANERTNGTNNITSWTEPTRWRVWMWNVEPKVADGVLEQCKFKIIII